MSTRRNALLHCAIMAVIQQWIDGHGMDKPPDEDIIRVLGAVAVDVLQTAVRDGRIELEDGRFETEGDKDLSFVIEPQTQH